MIIQCMRVRSRTQLDTFVCLVQYAGAAGQTLMILRIDTLLEVDIPHPAKPYLEGCETMTAYPTSFFIS
jgi:hypothetical protein